MDYTYTTSNDYPLRILVPSDAVGAIIGKQGSTIKQIKQMTHTKVDVNKNESPNSQERLIVIRGQPENCTQACREVLQIMYEDAKNKNKTQDIVLKVLAHNNFIGRIIGKGGNIINALKTDTKTNITVSSINELNSYNVERIISIKGELDQQIQALAMIYSKLCSANESDHARAWNSYSSLQYPQHQQQQLMHHFAQQAAVMNAAAAAAAPPLLTTHYAPQQQQPQASLMQHAQLATTNGSSSKYLDQQQAQGAQPTAQQANQPPPMYHPSYYPSMYPAPSQFYVPYPTSAHLLPSHPHPYGNLVANGNGVYPHPPLQPLTPNPSLFSSSTAPAAIETVHLYVPNTAIGAIIGTKGLFIKSIIKNSNAAIRIHQIGTNEDQNKIIDRQITISGTPEAQWKSQYYIYEKIRQEGYAGDDEVRLRAEIYVPTPLIGRLVGKGGQNVRQLQQATGAVIKLPEDSQQTSASEVPVKIIGSFQASQFAQRRIQSIIQMSRDSTHGTNEDSNHHNNEQSNNVHPNNNTSSNNLNESQTLVNGSTVSDDAVVASSTRRNMDDSIPAVVDQKSSDE